MTYQLSRRDFLMAGTLGSLTSAPPEPEKPSAPGVSRFAHSRQATGQEFARMLPCFPATVDNIAPASSEPDDAGADTSPPSSAEDCWNGAFLCGIVGIVGAFLMWSLASILIEGYWSWRLACNGVPVTATVLEYRPESVTHRSGKGGPSRTHVFHMHRVNFEDRVETVKLNGKHSIGAQIPVLYLPEKEGLVVTASHGDSAFTIFLSRIHGNTFLWLLLWIKLIVVTVLGWLFPGQGTEGTASGLIDSAAQAAVGGDQ